MKQVNTEDCWLFAGNTSTGGYGYICDRFGMQPAHRVVYQNMVGPIPKGLVMDHLCRVRICINPDHLEPVTDAENILRGIAPSAMNKRKTHCKRGHELSGDNLIEFRGGRHCRECARQWNAINRPWSVVKLKRAKRKQSSSEPEPR